MGCRLAAGKTKSDGDLYSQLRVPDGYLRARATAAAR